MEEASLHENGFSVFLNLQLCVPFGFDAEITLYHGLVGGCNGHSQEEAPYHLGPPTMTDRRVGGYSEDERSTPIL